MSNFENPTWRTAVIFKIVISPYLNRESSECDEICYADANFDHDKNSEFPKFKMGDGRHADNRKISCAVTYLLTRGLSFSTNSFKLHTKTRVPLK